MPCCIANWLTTDGGTMNTLPEADWRAVDRGLRAEAVEILRQLDELPTPAAEARF